jgi:GPH family glycoside/pentoside/hexuronide:cation symporter
MQSDVLFDDMLDGASWLAIIIGAAVIVIGVIPAIFLK